MAARPSPSSCWRSAIPRPSSAATIFSAGMRAAPNSTSSPTPRCEAVARPRSMLAEKEGEQHIARAGRHMHRLVQQRAGKDDRRPALRPIALIAEFGEAQLAALERLGVEVDRTGEAAIGGDGLRIVAMAVQLAAPYAVVTADAHAFAPRDLILEGATDLGEEAGRHPGVDERHRVLFDEPVIDAIGAAVFGNAHLVIGGDVVIAVAGLDEQIAAGAVDVDEALAIAGAQHVGTNQHRRPRPPHDGAALMSHPLDDAERRKRLRLRPLLDERDHMMVGPQHHCRRAIAGYDVEGAEGLAGAIEQDRERQRLLHGDSPRLERDGKELGSGHAEVLAPRPE